MALEQLRAGAAAHRARPPSLAEICAADAHARASHALGKSYSDVVRGFRGRFEHPPDFVARPREETRSRAGARVVRERARRGDPVRRRHLGRRRRHARTSAPATTAPSRSTCGALDRVLEVDEVSRAARIQAGALGPGLEAQLARARADAAPLPAVVRVLHARRLDRHARRRPLRDACGRTSRIFVESVRAITPAGVWESRRLPGSGAGVSPDRMLAGSEGTLGVITRGVGARAAAARAPALGGGALRELPRGRRVRARDLPVGAAPVQLPPARCRRGRADDGRRRLPRPAGARLRVDRPPGRRRRWRARCELCAEHGGARAGASRARPAGTRSSSWREAFLGAPYRARRARRRWACSRETFETAITWERFPVFHERVIAAAEQAVREQCGGERAACSAASPTSTRTAPRPTSRCSRPRGAARRSSSGPQIKRAVSDAIIAEGGTITHHHAVGRDHRPVV